ncbi:hypothetical protein [Leptospira levettii]|uniref:hypothetical protein n=1 Tax=Leptospira levettii TaxID=2023178 RepID=UPI00108383E4|nr:hypothetical protein [Leptospira levettii]TGM26410.1 hypothetical protein EHQ74_10885 [Leptospira levettii]TGM30348.1 hypothetical protein EHQ71_11540 [Leptospira levettii]
MSRVFYPVFLILLTTSCSQLSREEQLHDECDTTRKNGYLYMMPILQRHTTTGVSDTNVTYWVGNTELAYRKCISEAKKNEFNLRSN